LYEVRLSSGNLDVLAGVELDPGLEPAAAPGAPVWDVVAYYTTQTDTGELIHGQRRVHVAPTTGPLADILNALNGVVVPAANQQEGT